MRRLRTALFRHIQGDSSGVRLGISIDLPLNYNGISTVIMSELTCKCYCWYYKLSEKEYFTLTLVKRCPDIHILSDEFNTMIPS